MATLQQLEQAFLKAHEAGNTDDAMKLAKAIQNAKAQSHQTPVKTNTATGVLKGWRDPVDAGAQMLDKATPDSFSNSVNTFNNYLVDQGVPLQRMPPGGLNQQLQADEMAYQQLRAESGETGVDTKRLVGNITSPANLAIASKIPQPQGLLPNALSNAAGGAVLGTLSRPVLDDFMNQKIEQAKWGAIGGGSAPFVARSLSRIVNPKVPSYIDSLNRQGVDTTIGQRLGGVAKGIEDKLESLPWIGDIIGNARNRTFKEFNRTAINRALNPINKTLPDDLAGHEAIAYTRKTISQAYDDVLTGLSVNLDDQFTREFNQIDDMIKAGLPDELYDVWKKRILYQTAKTVTPYGKTSDQALKKIQEELRDNALKFQPSNDPFHRDLGDAFDATLKSFNDLIKRQNPAKASDLSKVNNAYANFKRIQRAATSVMAEDGAFTPAMLHNSVKALDKSKDKAAFAEGRALMQDLSNDAKKVLPNQVPNSGTFDRMAQAGIFNNLLGLGLSGPGYMLYNPASTKLVNTVLSQRPQVAQPIANAITQSTPYMIPGLTELFKGMNTPSK